MAVLSSAKTNTVPTWNTGTPMVSGGSNLPTVNFRNTQMNSPGNTPSSYGDMSSYWKTGAGAALIKGGNPYAGLAGQYASLGKQYGATGPGSFSFQHQAPDWTNPATMDKLNSYRTMMQGAQMASADDLIKQTANMGVRGGMSVSGGSPTAATMLKDQIGGIARQSSELYDQGLNWLDKNNRWNYSVGQDSYNNALKAAQLQQGAVDSSARYDLDLARMQHDDWRTQLDLNRQAHQDQLSEQQARKADELARTQRGNKEREKQRYEDLITNWPLNGNIGSGDPRALQDYLGTQIGMWEPAKRSYSVNTSLGGGR